MNKVTFSQPKWEKKKIITQNGKIEAIAPIIISASRSTDIPAFYSNWFINRFNTGYVIWINPFNGKKQYVSFEKARLIVFWTKNAKPIIKYLKNIDSWGIKYYFQYTLNDYEDEGLEPRLPKLADRIETFIELSNILGKEKVIWRFDPLILTNSINSQILLEKIYKVGSLINKHTEKLVISFVVIYEKVKRKLKRAGISYRQFEEKDIDEIASGLNLMNKEWNLEIATCAESIDLHKYGIKHNKCIDDELIIRLFKDDKELMAFFRVGKNDLLFTNNEIRNIKLKDKGQRKECGCIMSKDIGRYNTCGHLCIYCYANYSQEVVLKNIKKHTDNSESIV